MLKKSFIVDSSHYKREITTNIFRLEELADAKYDPVGKKK